MSEPSKIPFEPGRRDTGFEGRAELDAAWMRFRKSLVGLLKEGRRSDPETLAKLAPIAAEAAEVLRRLASDADAAADGSRRNRALLEREEQRLGRVLRKAARQGSPGAARMLRQMNESPLPKRRDDRPGGNSGGHEAPSSGDE